jgi:hypothetical protein
MLEELYNQKESITSQQSTNFQKLVNKQLEKIKTKNNKINSYLGLKKTKNRPIWLKITNSYANLDETEGDQAPHVLEGFYVSILDDNNYLHMAYNKPINKNIFDKIVYYLNSIQDLSVYDFVNYIQKTMNKKADWLDKSF